jgi:hypothetical protein
VAPTISSNGTLSYTLNPDVSGTANITFVGVNSGGTANGGVNTSASHTFTIDVNFVNQPPTFTLGATQTVNEIAAGTNGSVTVPNFITNISPGPGDPSSETVSFAVTTNNPSLFSVAPTISPNGTLTYTLNPDVSGTANITVVAMNSGGTTNGGVDTSVTQTFAIDVNFVNQAPSFTLITSPNQTVSENASTQTVADFANNINVGPGNPSSESVNFIVSTNNSSLFSVAPTISPDGTLTYTLAPNASGTAAVTVQIQNSGGTANGGVDTSLAQTFTINVTPTVKATAPTTTTTTTTSTTTTTVSTSTTSSASAPTLSAPAILGINAHSTATVPIVSQSDQFNESPQSQPSLFNFSNNEKLIQLQDNNTSQLNLNTSSSPVEGVKLSGLTQEEHQASHELESFGNKTQIETNVNSLAAPAAIATTFSASDINSLKLQKRSGFAAIMNIQLSGLNVHMAGVPATWKNGGNIVLHTSLKTQPNAKVIAHFKTSDPHVASVKPAKIEFNPANWYIEQEVVIMGLDGIPGTLNSDETITGGIQYDLIILPLESSDPSYRELEVSNVKLWALDGPPK